MKEHVIINRDRTVIVPESLKKIGIQFDHNVNTITFDCPRYPDEDPSIDMSQMPIFINYMLPDKTPGSSLALNVVVDETDDTLMHFDWKITNAITPVNGVLSTLICVKQSDVDGNELYHWNTDLFQKFTVGNGMECNGQVAEMNPDVITQLLARMGEVDTRTSAEAMSGYVNEYMTENPPQPTDEQVGSGVNTYMASNGQTHVNAYMTENQELVQNSVDDYLGRNPLQLDESLTDSTKAAPADKVGELKGDLDDYKDSISEYHKSVNLFDKTKITAGKILSTRNEEQIISGCFYTDYIEIKPNTKYAFQDNTGYLGENGKIVCLYKENKTFLGSYIATVENGCCTFTSDAILKKYYVRVNGRTSRVDSFMFVEGETLPTYEHYFEPYYMIKESALPKNSDPLYGKKLAVNGDSICYGAGASGGYAKYIGENNDMEVSNIAQTGGTIASGTTYSGGGNRHWICRTIENMPTDADYYILEGGSNDVALSVPIGDLSSGYIATLDDTTFYGAMESVCKQIITKFKGKKYGFLIVHQMKGGMQITDARYTAIIECCNKWGIPYLDLAKNCVPFGLFEKDWGNDLSSLRNTYTADDGTGYGDGWHPNEECYKKYYVPKIEAWMKTL